MKKEHPGPPPMKWKGQHIFPFGLCVKEMKSRFSSRPPSLPPVRNLTEFGTKTGSWFADSGWIVDIVDIIDIVDIE